MRPRNLQCEYDEDDDDDVGDCGRNSRKIPCCGCREVRRPMHPCLDEEDSEEDDDDDCDDDDDEEDFDEDCDYDDDYFEGDFHDPSDLKNSPDPAMQIIPEATPLQWFSLYTSPTPFKTPPNQPSPDERVSIHSLLTISTASQRQNNCQNGMNDSTPLNHSEDESCMNENMTNPFTDSNDVMGLLSKSPLAWFPTFSPSRIDCDTPQTPKKSNKRASPNSCPSPQTPKQNQSDNSDCVCCKCCDSPQQSMNDAFCEEPDDQAGCTCQGDEDEEEDDTPDIVAPKKQENVAKKICISLNLYLEDVEKEELDFTLKSVKTYQCVRRNTKQE